MGTLKGFPSPPARWLRRAKPAFAHAIMGTLKGFPSPPALWLRRAKPAFAHAIMGTLGSPRDNRIAPCIVEIQSDLLPHLFGPSLGCMLVCHASSPGRAAGTSGGAFAFLLACCGVAVAISGCAGARASSPGASGLNDQSDVEAKFDRSRCDDRGKQVVSADTNGDGKPDVIKLFTVVDQGGQKVQQLTCRQVDLNHDGKMDIIYTYGPGGMLMAEDFDLDFDGKFDERVYYQDGRKVRMERDMNGDGRPDYVEFFEGGKLVRVERDSNGDGKPDEWQYYENGRLDRIGTDTTGSGRADKWERNPETADAAPEGPASAGKAPAAKGAAPADPAPAPAAAGGDSAAKQAKKR